MISSTLLLGGFKLVLAILAIAGARLSLAWFDSTPVARTFQTERLNKWSDHAQAIYLGCRFVGVMLCIGLILS